MSHYLTNSEYEKINWKGPLRYNGMVRIRVPGDGSCFFHAIAKAYFRPYILGKINNSGFNRKKFIRDLRKDLAKKLGQPVDPTDTSSLTHYDLLSRGQLRQMSKEISRYSLKNMVNELGNDRPVDNLFNEFISNELNKDIYILDGIKQDVYMVGDDSEILYKDRPSIVLLYLPGHYELIGVKEGGRVKTLFGADHDLIRLIQDRIKVLKA